MAEWSKALVLGTSLSGRGFESHRCQKKLLLQDIDIDIDMHYAFTNGGQNIMNTGFLFSQ